jgi:hypothetical protein
MGATRRGFLKAAAGTAAIGSLAGCLELFGASPSTGSQAAAAAIDGSSEVTPLLDPNRYADRFDNVVNLVEDAGADPTGEEPIGDALSSAWDDNTLIVVPEGVYKMNRAFRRTRWENVGLIGQGAVIRHGEVEAIRGHYVTEGEYSGSTMLFRLGTAGNPHQGDLVFGGFIFDWAWHEDAGMQGINAFVDGRLEIMNLVFYGRHSLGTHGNMRAATATPESAGIVSNIDMRGGGKHYINTINSRSTRRYDGSVQSYEDGTSFGQSWSTTGVTGHPDMEGTMVFNNITCGPWSGSCVYVRGGPGRKIISNCTAANSGGAQYRTDGDDAWAPIEWIDGTEDKQEALEGPYGGGSVIENCRLMINHVPEWVHQGQQGILFQDGRGHVARNCEIALGVDHGTGAGGSYGIGTRGSADDVRIEDCRISLQDRADAIYVSPQSGSVEIENLQVQTNGWYSGSPSRVINGRSPASMANVVVDGQSIA